MKASEEAKRLFLGIPLPADMIALLMEIKALNPLLPSVRWIPEKNWHITVHFFGDVQVRSIQDLMHQLKPIIHTISPFSLTFQKFQLAPNRNPRMIWGQFAPNNSFTGLVQEISRLAGETKAFSKEPKIHVTLARFRQLKSKYLVNFPELLPARNMLVTQISVWESELTPEGAVYTVVEEFSLMD